jgi:hypothetical protein
MNVFFFQERLECSPATGTTAQEKCTRRCSGIRDLLSFFIDRDIRFEISNAVDFEDPSCFVPC